MHIGLRTGCLIQAGRVTDQNARTDAGLEQQPHHARSHVSGRCGNHDAHRDLPFAHFTGVPCTLETRFADSSSLTETDKPTLASGQLSGRPGLAYLRSLADFTAPPGVLAAR
ncbi:hypothetical protein HOK021_34740 [Streptomyces hygroscopicus]|nr:hypothetical protein HOK021_34740 [Streptomyces hygroscopicus]